MMFIAMKYYKKYLLPIFSICAGFILGCFINFLQLIKNERTNIFDQFSHGKFMKESEIYANIDQIQSAEKYMSQVLYNETKLLCWIMHNFDSVDKRMAVMDTWGRRCNLVLFVVGNLTAPSIKRPRLTVLAPNVHLVELKMNDSYDLLWLKTKLAFTFIVKSYSHKFDWLYKVDDDSFVVVENLKLFLKYKNPYQKVYYGCQLKLRQKKGLVVYSSGGPGYVMSSHIARQFVKSLKNPECPQGDDGSEDVNVAVCLALRGVYPSDTRDEFRRFRFVPFPPQEAVDEYSLKQVNSWFYEHYSVHQMQTEFNCCSDSAIAYHYVTPSMMRTLEYLVYYLHPFSSRNV